MSLRLSSLVVYVPERLNVKGTLIYLTDITKKNCFTEMASHSKVKDCIALLMVFGTLASVTHVTNGYFVRDAYAKIVEVKDVANHSERKVEYLSTSSSEGYFDFKYVDSGGMTRSTGKNHTEVSYDSNSTRLSGHCGGNPVNEASSSDVSELKQMTAQNTELFRDYNINKGPQSILTR